LSSAETHAELVTHTDHGYMTVQLNGNQLDSLKDALENVQEHYDG